MQEFVLLYRTPTDHENTAVVWGGVVEVGALVEMPESHGRETP